MHPGSALRRDLGVPAEVRTRSRTSRLQRVALWRLSAATGCAPLRVRLRGSPNPRSLLERIYVSQALSRRGQKEAIWRRQATGKSATQHAMWHRDLSQDGQTGR